MSDYNKYVPLKTVVSMALDEEDQSIGSFDKAWVLAFRGMIKLNQSIAAEPKSIRIPLNGNKTANLPTDYLSWTKIGIMDSNGQISTLKINTGLSILKDTNPNRLDYLTNDINTNLPLLLGSAYFYNYWYNGMFQTLYGLGGGLVQYGECRVDEKNKVIIFPPDFRFDSVLIEYMSSPQMDEDYMIQTVLQEALIAFIKWKLKKGTRQDFYAEATEARRSLPGKKVTLQKLNQVIREANGQYLHA